MEVRETFAKDRWGGIVGKRILWGEGMFLRPQHFQQQAIHTEWLLRQSVASHVAYPYGVRQLALDEEALGRGVLRLERMLGVMSDGTAIDIPGADPEPPQRNLQDIPGLEAEAVVYLSLPALSLFGSNSCEDGNTARAVRYLVHSEPSADLFTSAQDAELSVLRHRYSLLVDRESRDGQLALPVARIQQSPTGKWFLAENYVAPCIDIHASQTLVVLCRRLVEMLFAKSQQLSARHRERAKNIAEHSTSDISSYWLLHTVNRSYPAIRHLLRSPLVHPERLYLVLAELLGELLTFSVSGSLHEIPEYNHDNLYDTFLQMERSIHDLLDTVISTRYVVIPLRCTKPSIYIGQLDNESLVGNIDFYLSVESHLPAAQLVDAIPAKLKVGSPEDVDKIVHSALPGVRLSHAAQTPGAIPVRINNTYFSLQPDSSLYERMCASRSICVYVPSAFTDMKIELVGVVR